jgi:SepF-like predicted cell division protein (DUF552 family)
VCSLKLWKKEEDILNSGSPHEALGFSKENDFLHIPGFIQNFLIKKYEFNSLDQVPEIKKQLMGKNILIVNAEKILKSNKTVTELKLAIDEIKEYLKKSGGSIGRIGEYYLILTPNANIKIAN